MSFSTKIVNPQAPSPLPNTQPTSTQLSAKQRAIAMLTAGGPAQVESAPAEVSIAAAVANTEVQSDTSGASESEAASPVAETKAAATPEKPLSSEYAILARKEKALRAKVQAQEQTLAAKEAAIAAREEAIKLKDAEYQSKYISKDRLTQDTLNALSEAGLSYEQITELMLNPPPKQDPATQAYLQRLEAKIKSLEEGVDNQKKTYENQQTDAYKQAVNHIRNQAKQLVYSDESYEMIKGTNSVNDVVELVERTFKEGLGDQYPKGTVLEVEQAAQIVEDHLVEEALKLAKLKKIQQKLQPVKEPAPKSTGVDPAQPQSKTLTNSLGVSRQLTAKERAILAFKGELPKK